MKSVFSIQKIALSSIMIGSFFIFGSCGGENDDPSEIITPPTPVKPNVPVVPETPVIGNLSASEQKKKLDEAGQKFLDYIETSELKYFSQLEEYLDHDMDDYNDKEITEWARNLIDKMTVKTGSWSDSEDYYYENRTYYYTDYDQLIILSNFTGHFTAANKKWSYSDASDLQFSFTDHEGEQCTLVVKTSGDSKDVFWEKDEERDWNFVKEIRDKYYYEIYEDTYNRSLRIPSKIEASFKQGKETRAELLVNLDLNGIKKQEFDIARDAISASGTAKFGDYTLKNTQIAYDATKSASVSSALYKGNTLLVSVAATAQGNYQQEDVKMVNLSADILGLVQVKGSISDGRSFYDYYESAQKHDDSESRFKSNISLANDLLNLGVYYDGKSNREAKVLLESFHNSDRWHDYWYATPVFYFGDDSAYTTFDVYFENGFDKLRAKFEKLLNDFEKLF